MIPSKKGIVLKFIMTIILAIIIFSFATVAVAKIFKVGTQTRDNFFDFKDEIRNLQQSPYAEEKGSALLILDKEAAAVYFEPNSEHVLVKADFFHLAGTPPKDEEYYTLFKKPNECKKDKSCFCLITEYEMKDEVVDEMLAEIDDNDNALITPKKSFCDSTIGLLEMEPKNNMGGRNNCGLGVTKMVLRYTCNGGFIIDRGIMGVVADEVIQDGEDYQYTLLRRTSFQLIKRGNKVILQG